MTQLTLKSIIIEAAISDYAVAQGKEAKGAVSQHLLTLAKSYTKPEEFLKACTDAETYMRSDAGKADASKAFEREGFKGVQVDGIPTTWIQAKSNIKTAWGKHGLDPKKYDTESSMRKALNNARKAGKGKVTAVGVKLTKDAHTAVSYLLETMGKLPPDKQDECAVSILSTADKFKAVADELTGGKQPVEAKANGKGNAKQPKNAPQPQAAQA